MRVPATGCAVLLASALMATQPASGREDELALGLVRPDGILTPVALFDGTRWVNPWPDYEDDDPKLDRMLAAVPSWWRDRRREVPQAWHVLQPSGKDVRAAVLTHVIFDEHCGRQIGLLTDLPRSAEGPHEKRLASTAPGRIARTVDYSNAGASPRAWRPPSNWRAPGTP